METACHGEILLTGKPAIFQCDRIFTFSSHEIRPGYSKGWHLILMGFQSVRTSEFLQAGLRRYDPNPSRDWQVVNKGYKAIRNRVGRKHWVGCQAMTSSWLERRRACFATPDICPSVHGHLPPAPNTCPQKQSRTQPHGEGWGLELWSYSVYGKGWVREADVLVMIFRYGCPGSLMPGTGKWAKRFLSTVWHTVSVNRLAGCSPCRLCPASAP